MQKNNNNRGGCRPGAGRPKLAEHQKRQTRTIRLTDQEIEFIRADADKQLAILLNQRIETVLYSIDSPTIFPDEKSDLREQVEIMKELLNIVDYQHLVQYQY